MLDLNDATVIYSDKGIRRKLRIVFKTSMDQSNDDTITCIYFKPERIILKDYEHDIVSLLKDAERRRGLNQKSVSVLRTLMYQNSAVKDFINRPYLDNDSIQTVFESKTIDEEVLAHFVLKCMYPALYERQIPREQILRINKDVDIF